MVLIYHPRCPNFQSKRHISIKLGNLNWSHVWSLSQQSMLRLETSVPTAFSSFVNHCWQVQSQPELTLQTLVGPLGLSQGLLVSKTCHMTARIMLRHSLQCCYFSQPFPAQPWNPAQCQPPAPCAEPRTTARMGITARFFFPRMTALKNNYYRSIKQLI